MLRRQRGVRSCFMPGRLLCQGQCCLDSVRRCNVRLHSGTDKATCCDANEACGAASCPAGYSAKASAASTACAGATCDFTAEPTRPHAATPTRRAELLHARPATPP